MLQTNIKNIYLKSALTLLYLLLCLIIFSIVLNIFYHSHLSKNLTRSVESIIKTSEYRQVILILSNSRNFQQISFQATNDVNSRFEVFPITKSSQFFSKTQSVNIYFDEDKTILLGKLNFTYAWANWSLYVLGFWILLVILSLIIIPNIKKKMQISFDNELKWQRAETMFDIASQVSHDIRSPLASLQILLTSLDHFPEEKRIMIRNAVNRINDISNHLLERSKVAKASIDKQPSPYCDKFELTLLSSLIDNLISEKRAQLQNIPHVVIEGDFNQGYGLFSLISPFEFKRVLSNLINNAAEALPASGSGGLIKISLEHSKAHIILKVQDNGKGIPDQILNKLGEKGVTFGKEGHPTSGSGLGFYHAKKTIEAAEGNIIVHSKEYVGTTIEIRLPKVDTPEWFMDKLFLYDDLHIIVLDDDLSIHGVWKNRLEGLHYLDRIAKMSCFTSGDDFKAFVQSSNISNSLFLIDYELLNQDKNGLDLIEDLALGSRAILVTSRFEEPLIRQRANRLAVKIIPKSMAGFIPIHFEQSGQKLDWILIDDDPLIRTTWEIHAKNKNQKCKTFSHPDNFFNEAHLFNFNTPIYVDSSLSHDLKGEFIAKEIFQLGFKNLYLSTGYSSDHFPKMEWIKEIVGKYPPI